MTRKYDCPHQSSLVGKYPELADSFFEGVLNFFTERLKEEYMSIESVCTRSIKRAWLTLELMINHSKAPDLFSYSDLKVLKEFSDEYGADVLISAYEHIDYRRVLTETELDFYGQMGAYLKANDIFINWETFSIWAERGFNINPTQLEMNTTSDRSLFKEAPNPYNYNDSLAQLESIFDKLKGWAVLEFENERSRDWYDFKVRYLNNDMSKREFMDLYNNGKHRLIKKNSAFLKDRLEVNGLGSLTKCVTNYEVNYAWALVTNVERGVKVNLKLVKYSTDYEIMGITRFHTAYASAILGESWVEASTYLLQHIFQASFEIPQDKKKGLLNEKVFSWVYEQELNIDWTVSKGAKQCVLVALKNTYGLTDSQAEVLFEYPSQLEAIEWSRNNPQTVKEDSLPNVEGLECQGWALKKLPKDDITNLVIGDYTSCCQKLGGFGESVCKEGWNDEHSVNYVFVSPSGRIAAHFWAWKTESGAVVIDSVEGNSSTPTDVVCELLLQFLDSVEEEVFIADTHYGLTGKVIKGLKKVYELVPNSTPKSITPYSYYDAKDGVFLIV